MVATCFSRSKVGTGIWGSLLASEGWWEAWQPSPRQPGAVIAG